MKSTSRACQIGGLSSSLILVLVAIFSQSSCKPGHGESKKSIRFASYNVAMYRDSATQLNLQLSTGQDTQSQHVAAVIQRVRPDVLALMEFDYDSSGKTLQRFQENYLQQSQFGSPSISYPYASSFPSNTGVLSGYDLNNDSVVALPDDGYGYGRYAGQYAFSLLSKYPILVDDISSYQNLLWSQLPNPSKPVHTDGTAYYAAEAWEALRISSKNHVVVPIVVPDDQIVHVILAHPTPPVFDGVEDRNGHRNYDEIRVIADIISGADYLVDDQGRSGGLGSNARFIVMGDLNADIQAGDSRAGSIDQLLHHPLINQKAALGDHMPASQGGAQQSRSRRDQPSQATSIFGLRIDYVLPSKNLQTTGSGVFWPVLDEKGYDLIAKQKASDHLLVFVDVLAGK